MRIHITAVLAILTIPAGLQAQVTAPAPAGVSSGPRIRLFSPDGVVHYALTLSEMYETGNAIPGSPMGMTIISGDLSYQSPNTKRPFSILYAGGWEGSTDSQMPSTQFHSLSMTQGLTLDKTAISISNQLSYLPETPSVGVAGIPGVGDLGLQAEGPQQAPAPTLLSGYANSLNEMVTGTVARRLDYNTSLVGSADWGHLYFLSGTGLTTTQAGASAGINRRFSALSNAGVNYAFTQFSYGGLGYTFDTHSINLAGHRQWTRALTTSASIGPEWIVSSGPAAVPSQTALAVSATVAYSRRLQSFTAFYSRGSNAGSGILPGAFSSTVQGSAQETFRRSWAFALTGGYTSTSGIGFVAPGESPSSATQSIGTEFASVQGSRALGRSFSAYASYTYQHQSFGQSVPATSGLNGGSQIIGAGITFSPKSKHLGQL